MMTTLPSGEQLSVIFLDTEGNLDSLISSLVPMQTLKTWEWPGDEATSSPGLTSFTCQCCMKGFALALSPRALPACQCFTGRP